MQVSMNDILSNSAWADFSTKPTEQQCKALSGFPGRQSRLSLSAPCTLENALSLAIFDLDNTLLRGDSDYAWGEFLVEQGAVDRERFARENDRYYAAYLAGTLDIYEFLEKHQLRPLAEHDRETLERWRVAFMRSKIAPLITPAARALVEKHRHRGDTLLIITATNRFITAPIAAELGVPHLIATEPEEVNGRFTGKVAGVPSYREGKVTRLTEWLHARNENLQDSWFYSDSHNDLPLLNLVAHPVAVNPDETLAEYARNRGWEQLDLRG
jgi:HAD superfamily hydrolase (TIGR01490 family)